MDSLHAAARLVWLASLGWLGLTYADTLRLTLPRKGLRYLRARSRDRLILGLVEGALVAGALSWHLGWIGPNLSGVAGSSSPIGPISGALATLAGTLLAVRSKKTLGRLFTANLAVKEDHRLVSEGPYAWVRHPIYLSILIVVLGTGLTLNSVSFLVLALLLIPCFWIQIRIEEGILFEHFGPAFAAYRDRVPALFPWRRASRATSR